MSGQCGSVIEWVLEWRDVAAYQDPFVTGYSAELPADKAWVGGVTVAPSPEGIVVRRDNPAPGNAPGNAPRQALAVIIPDGTYVQFRQIPADPGRPGGDADDALLFPSDIRCRVLPRGVATTQLSSAALA
jgi:hypothetical protein